MWCSHCSVCDAGGEVGRLGPAAPHHHAQTHLLLQHVSIRNFNTITPWPSPPISQYLSHYKQPHSHHQHIPPMAPLLTCSTDSMYIMSRSETIAPFITMISSPLIIPVEEGKITKLKTSVWMYSKVCPLRALGHWSGWCVPWEIILAGLAGLLLQQFILQHL